MQLSCGGAHTLVLLADGNVVGMGSNEFGQIGIKMSDESKTVDVPAVVPTFKDRNVKELFCGNEHSIVLTKDGEVYTWGRGQYGQLGLGEKQVGPLETPTKITSLPKIVKIYSGPNQTFAVEFTNGNVVFFLIFNRRLSC